MAFNRLVTYRSVLNGYLRRRGFGSASTVDEDVLTDAAEYITSANRYCLETWRWPEAQVAGTVAVSGSVVPWTSILGADHYEFWTGDPDDLTAPEQAQPIAVRRIDQAGLHLDTTLTSVWARYTPRAPSFAHRPVEEGATYDAGTVVYDGGGTGHMFEALVDAAAGNALDDTAQWRALPLLWLLTEPVKLLAVAEALGNNEHERAQAADLRAQAEELLTQMQTRVQMHLPPPL